jgi:predicted nucleic acid-binding protein
MAPKAGDLVFLDTNILLTATDSSRKNHRPAKAVFTKALDSGVHLCAGGQIIREYLVVATRDTSLNGLGMSPEHALSNAEQFKKRMTILEEIEDVTENLMQLVRTHRLKGSRIHDANIAALMQTHNIRTLLTENINDFSRFASLETMTLEEFEGYEPRPV